MIFEGNNSSLLLSQNGHGLKSPAKVKDVCPIVGVEVGARVRAHFYYENGQKSKSWREAQVQKPREIGFPYTERV